MKFHLRVWQTFPVHCEVQVQVAGAVQFPLFWQGFVQIALEITVMLVC